MEVWVSWVRSLLANLKYKTRYLKQRKRKARGPNGQLSKSKIPETKEPGEEGYSLALNLVV